MGRPTTFESSFDCFHEKLSKINPTNRSLPSYATIETQSHEHTNSLLWVLTNRVSRIMPCQLKEPPLSGPTDLLVYDGPLVHRDDAFRRRRTIAEGAMRADRVVVAPPLLDEDLGNAQGLEYLAVQQFVPEPGVEALAIPVLPG